jgi:hypothetical protein
VVLAIDDRVRLAHAEIEGPPQRSAGVRQGRSATGPLPTQPDR